MVRGFMGYPVATILVLSCTLLGGCSVLDKPSPELMQQQQQKALTRWQNCLNRISNQASDRPIEAASDLITDACEGHRRDVLLTFPASMERQLDALLMERGLRAAIVQIDN